MPLYKQMVVAYLYAADTEEAKRKFAAVEQTLKTLEGEGGRGVHAIGLSLEGPQVVV